MCPAKPTSTWVHVAYTPCEGDKLQKTEFADQNGDGIDEAFAWIKYDTFDGADVFSRSESQLARLRRTEVGFVFQFGNLLSEMTALENAMVPALLQRLPAAAARERAQEALADVGLSDRMHHRPGELSGGEQQRVAIARALCGRPRVILADEPTGNLDPKTSEVVWDLFQRLQAERGVAFVVATHNHELARRADRGYQLVEGRTAPWP